MKKNTYSNSNQKYFIANGAVSKVIKDSLNKSKVNSKAKDIES